MAKKNQLTKSGYLPMEEYKKLLRLLHKDRQYLWELYARLAFCLDSLFMAYHMPAHCHPDYYAFDIY